MKTRILAALVALSAVAANEPAKDPAKKDAELAMTTILTSTVLTAAATAALITGVVNFLVQERRLKSELRLEFQAERAVRRLLEDKAWDARTFEKIQEQIGGFTDDELRKLLVRCGAVRYYGTDDTEFWGLLHKVRGYIS